MTPRKATKRKNPTTGSRGLLQTSLTAFLAAPRAVSTKVSSVEGAEGAAEVATVAKNDNKENDVVTQQEGIVKVSYLQEGDSPSELRCDGDLDDPRQRSRRVSGQLRVSDESSGGLPSQQQRPRIIQPLVEKGDEPTLHERASLGGCTAQKLEEGAEATAGREERCRGAQVERTACRNDLVDHKADETMTEGEQVSSGIPPAQSVQQDGRADEDIGVSGNGSAEDNGENEFEREREARIRRNQMMMMQLGIDNAAVGIGVATQAAPKRRPLQRRAMRKNTAEPVPVRRSSRSRGPSASGAAVELTAVPPLHAADVEGTKEEEVEYDDSDVLRYVCESANSDQGFGDVFPTGHRVRGFTLAALSMCDAKLTRAYGMDKSGDLLVAGGHQGWASIWGLGDASELGEHGEDIEPLMSAKLHSGWICDVQFVARGSGQLERNAPLLLSASNDAAVALWDVSKAATGNSKPLKLLESRDIHQGGIFSMHVFGSSILTASKDYTVAVSEIRSEAGTLNFIRRFDFHNGVVKCARWRDGGHTFASGGNDRAIYVCDCRSSTTAPSLTFSDAHLGSVNHLQWNPRSEHLLLSSGFDDAVQVFDTRSPATPLMTFRGHSRKTNSIYQPLWGDGGKCVITGGDSRLLSVYCCATAKALSRGEIGFEPKAACLADPSAAASSPLFLATTKRIVKCQPVPMASEETA